MNYPVFLKLLYVTNVGEKSTEIICDEYSVTIKLFKSS